MGRLVVGGVGPVLLAVLPQSCLSGEDRRTGWSVGELAARFRTRRKDQVEGSMAQALLRAACRFLVASPKGESTTSIHHTRPELLVATPMLLASTLLLSSSSWHPILSSSSSPPNNIAVVGRRRVQDTSGTWKGCDWYLEGCIGTQRYR